MTETQAKSGTAGTSANPVDEEAAEGGTPATGRAAVGRAAVPADGPSPKFTRAPGMPPPPDQPPSDSDAGPAGSAGAASGPFGGSAAAERAAAAGGTGGPERTAPSGGADRATSGGGSSGPGRPGTGPGTPVTGANHPANVTVPIAGGGAQAGSDPASSGVGAQAKAAAQSVIGLARSTGLGRFAPGGGGTTTRPDAGAARTGGAGTARTTSPLRPPGSAPVGGASAVGAARVTEAVRAARSTVGSAASRGPRRARLNVKRIDPWSVMKFSFAVSLVLFIVVIVATSVLYLALDAMGVFESVNSSLTDLVNAGGGASSDVFKITAKGVILTSALIGLINVVLFTALATLGAFVYNVCADLVGGIELTLAERD